MVFQEGGQIVEQAFGPAVLVDPGQAHMAFGNQRFAPSRQYPEHRQPGLTFHGLAHEAGVAFGPGAVQHRAHQGEIRLKSPAAGGQSGGGAGHLGAVHDQKHRRAHDAGQLGRGA